MSIPVKLILAFLSLTLSALASMNHWGALPIAIFIGGFFGLIVSAIADGLKSRASQKKQVASRMSYGDSSNKTGWLRKAKTAHQVKKFSELAAEERLYMFVGEEIESGDIRPGLWTKATTLASSGNEADIKREYIRLRAEMLKAEGSVFQRLLDELPNADEVVEADAIEIPQQSQKLTLGRILWAALVIFVLAPLVATFVFGFVDGLLGYEGSWQWALIAAFFTWAWLVSKVARR